MKVIMVIIICFGANCQAIWDKQHFSSINDCLSASGPVKEYMMNTYPDSAGEIYCMTESEFNNYYQFLEDGGNPSITNPNPDAS